MHIVLSCSPEVISWRISDGRTGSDQTYGMIGPTLALILHRVGAISETGVTPGWTYEILT